MIVKLLRTDIPQSRKVGQYRVMETTINLLISLCSSLIFTTPFFVLILHDFTCILNVGGFVFLLTHFYTETSPNNLSSTKLLYIIAPMASQFGKTFAMFGSKVLLVITLNTKSMLLVTWYCGLKILFLISVHYQPFAQ